MSKVEDCPLLTKRVLTTPEFQYLRGFCDILKVNVHNKNNIKMEW